jgi:hypothetical protein
MLLINHHKTPHKILHVGVCVNGKPYNALQKAFIKFSKEYTEINPAEPDLHNKIVKILHLYKPNIVFMQIQGESGIDKKTVLAIKESGAAIYNWTGDVRSPIPKWMIDIGGLVDCTLFTNMNDVITMRSLGYKSNFLQIGIDENIFTPKGSAHNNTLDVIFMGNHYSETTFPMSKYRFDMVSFLTREFGDNFGVYGAGWMIKNGDLNGSQLTEASVYRSSKIAINVSHFEYSRYSSDRLLRILGTGTFCLCKHYPDIEQDFIDGVHLRTWKTMEELKELIEYYLLPANEKERKKIAMQGSELVHKLFTFDSMIENLIKLYENNNQQ